MAFQSSLAFDLPVEMTEEVFSSVSIKDLKKLRLTTKAHKVAADGELIRRYRKIYRPDEFYSPPVAPSMGEMINALSWIENKVVVPVTSVGPVESSQSKNLLIDLLLSTIEPAGLNYVMARYLLEHGAPSSILEENYTLEYTFNGDRTPTGEFYEQGREAISYLVENFNMYYLYPNMYDDDQGIQGNELHRSIRTREYMWVYDQLTPEKREMCIRLFGLLLKHGMRLGHDDKARDILTELYTMFPNARKWVKLNPADFLPAPTREEVRYNFESIVSGYVG